jgi:hypothetical protein
MHGLHLDGDPRSFFRRGRGVAIPQVTVPPDLVRRALDAR